MSIKNWKFHILVIAILLGSLAYSQIPRKFEVIRGDNNVVKGHLSIALLYGEGFRPPTNYTNGMYKLADAMNAYTEIQTNVDQMISLASGKMNDYPVVFLMTDGQFTPTPSEKLALKSYFERGGLLVIDHPFAYRQSSPVLTSARQMIRDTMGSSARIMPLPFDHKLNFCFFKFPEIPFGIELDQQRQEAEIRTDSQGNKMGGTWTGKRNAGVIEGVFYKNRLIALIMDKGYIISWMENDELSPQLKYGVNIIMYALLEGGMVSR